MKETIKIEAGPELDAKVARTIGLSVYESYDESDMEPVVMESNGLRFSL